MSNFPPEGITVLIPYPAGTSAATHDFVVTHMITTSLNGHTPGEIETPAVTKTPNGLLVTFTGLSPVTVGWKSTTPVADSGSSISTIPQTGDEFPITAVILVMMLSATAIIGLGYSVTKKRNLRECIGDIYGARKSAQALPCNDFITY